MARQKQTVLVILFSHTTDALAAESFFQDRALPGRLIPTPQSVTAGCGLAWMAPQEERDRLPALLTEAGLRQEAAVLVEMWA